MEKLIILCCLILMFSCSKKFSYVSETDKITGLKTKEFYQKEGLIAIGSGGAMMDEVTKISITFQLRHCVHISEARRLCVYCIEELKDAVNDVKSLEPYLSPYPFPASGMDIAIMFHKSIESFVDFENPDTGEKYIAVVFQRDNELYYDIYNPSTKRLESYYIEPYEEALALVRQAAAEKEANKQ